MWYRVAAPSVTSATASFASGTTKSLAMSVSEWSGVASASALDMQGNSSGGLGDHGNIEALTTTNATDVVIGALDFHGKRDVDRRRDGVRAAFELRRQLHTRPRVVQRDHDRGELPGELVVSVASSYGRLPGAQGRFYRPRRHDPADNLDHL